MVLGEVHVRLCSRNVGQLSLSSGLSLAAVGVFRRSGQHGMLRTRGGRIARAWSKNHAREAAGSATHSSPTPELASWATVNTHNAADGKEETLHQGFREALDRLERVSEARARSRKERTRDTEKLRTRSKSEKHGGARHEGTRKKYVPTIVLVAL